MRAILLSILLLIIMAFGFGLIFKAIGDITHYIDFKKDHTHDDEED